MPLLRFTNLSHRVRRETACKASTLCMLTAILSPLIASPVSAQTIRVDGVGTVVVTGATWRYLGRSSFFKFYATPPTTLETRGETGIYVITVNEDAALVAAGISATISGYGYDCDRGTVVEFSSTDLSGDGRPTDARNPPRLVLDESGNLSMSKPVPKAHPPAISRAPKYQYEQWILKSVCGDFTYRTTTDPLHDD